MAEITPLLKQYHRIKEEHKDCILLFRMGDFYETFYKDAEVASQVLGIALTSRPHGKGRRVPLAGVPYRSADSYVAKLVKAGYKVAICEQLENGRAARSLVRRGVVEVVTPGTVTNPSLLVESRNIYLGGIGCEGEVCGLAVCDLTTGEFSVTELGYGELSDELKRIEPEELVLPESMHRREGWGSDLVLTPLEDHYFSYELAYSKLTSHFKVASLDGYGCQGMKPGIGAAGAVLSYLEETQRRSLPHITKLSPYERSQFMVLDSTTRRNLELTNKQTGEEGEGTLLSVIDYTQTPMGGRTLRGWLSAPLLDVERIEERLEAVGELVKNSFLRGELRKVLKSITDMERLLGRVSTERANGRDLASIKKSLSLLPELREFLSGSSSGMLGRVYSELSDFSPLVEHIERAIVDTPPLTITDGGLIRDGYSEELDSLRALSSRGKEWIAELQSRERQRTGIGSLKVGYNSVFGYYIEVTRPNLNRVPQDYMRKQTLSGAERFITPELKDYESKVLSAEEQQKSLEYELFTRLRAEVALQGEPIQRAARAIAELDSLLSLAHVAVLRDYRRPVVKDGDELSVVEGRHPVVEALLGEGSFVPNDINMNTDTEQILLITGPNMSGKSTYLRQVGLISILAQMGSFVPAKEAKLGVVDRIFTRVGASDDLSRGVSTFLAEMSQTANILNNATPKSLIILDEIGRGTSTFDGLSIAWAVVEYIHSQAQVSAKTLFATHYHELTQLERLLPRVKNYSVAVKEWGDEVIFLYKLLPGRSDRSYGIQVARMAGLPSEVVERAKEVLRNLESDELTPAEYPRIARGEHSPVVREAPQLSLFGRGVEWVVEELRRLSIENLTPLEALEKLDELKKRVGDG